MKRAKYLTVVFVGTLVYVIMSLGFGQNSLRCYSKMEEQKRIVSKQKAEIQSINTELSLELTALKNDKAVIAAYARKMDYVSEKLCKMCGICAAMFVFLIMLIFDFKKGNVSFTRDKKEFVAGIPVYNVPQV